MQIWAFTVKYDCCYYWISLVPVMIYARLFMEKWARHDSYYIMIMVYICILLPSNQSQHVNCVAKRLPH